MVAKCPACRKEITKAKKAWKYSRFNVRAYACECGTDFREYERDGKHSFTLKRSKDGKFRKV